MALKCQTIINHLETFAPKFFAEEWDNVGLLVGDSKQEVKKVLLALDANMDVIEEAVQKQIDMVITHHPIIFRPIKNIRRDSIQGEMIYKVIQNNISVYCAHTNLDAAVGGLNDYFAEKIGLLDTKILDPIYEQYKKIIVYVPKGHEDRILEAMSEAGAGWMGNYCECAFMSEGIGTFRPLEGANPYIGEKGKLEKVAEVRLEMLCLESKVKKVIQAMLKAHPYEEAAYDILSIDIETTCYGIGRIGVLSEGVKLSTYVQHIKTTLGLSHVRVIGDLDKEIRKVALCTGAGAGYIRKAYYQGADILITGDIKYHEAQEAESLGVAIIDAGHFGTEYIVSSLLKKYLKDLSEKTKEELDILISESNKELFQFL